ncbi:efflux RND transporter periplasmic adaptor subunit [Paludisphaera borealis]|uniref:Toluene efflux pump periplasmic linker protein TtgG n=1 Tax=Paludisphaera borealis TaxID=1387353 RepID=A0A1U7CPJ7_9BACT|nr:efflux RND transporter periplasmic adaptor subunit [Paludisphaera borealis]APW60865.1 Toluene efflux pump periplasmic linker protein TtgG [Paludisphaera borealis]
MDRRVFAALALLACTTVAGCGGAANSSTQIVKPPDVVLYARPVTRSVTDHEEFPGRTEAIMSVQVTSRVSGYLNQVYFQDGQQVEKGAVLFQIDPRPFQADLDRAKAANLQAEAHAKRLNNEFQRAKVLYDRGMSISREEYDRYSFDNAEAAASVGTAKANFDLADLNLEFTRVVAPIGGRLGRRLVDPGNLVKADDTPLVTIVSQDPIYVYFDVHEQAMLKIRRMINEGRVKAKSEHEVPIELCLSDERDFQHRGMVDFTDNRVDLSTGTLRFRARLDNPKGMFTPGLFVRVKLPIGDPHPALMVREEAVTSDQGQKKVFVVRRSLKDGQPAFFEDKTGKPILDRDGKPIPKFAHTTVNVGTLGVLIDGYREVSEGVKPDDLVVVSGLQKLRKDAPVTAREFNSDSDALPEPKTAASGTPRTTVGEPPQPPKDGRADTSAADLKSRGSNAPHAASTPSPSEAGGAGGDRERRSQAH